MKFKAWGCVLAVMVMLSVTVGSASAAPIYYSFTGVATSGDIDGVPFTNQTFTITYAADTGGITSHVVALAVTNQSVTLHLSGTDHAGVFIGSSYLFPDGTFAHVGVPAGDYWEDALFYASSPGLVGYDLGGPIGPVNITLPVSYLPSLLTTEGVFRTFGLSALTFQAVPEPSPLALGAAGAVMVLARRRAVR